MRKAGFVIEIFSSLKTLTYNNHKFLHSMTKLISAL